MMRRKVSKSLEEEEVMAEETEEEIELNNPKILYRKLISNKRKTNPKIIINQEHGWMMLRTLTKK